MIKCQDFAPRITKREPFGGSAEYESFSEIVSAANQWIGDRTIQVINVETIILPDSLEGTSDGVYGLTVSNGFYPVTVSSGITLKFFQCVRVWHRE